MIKLVVNKMTYKTNPTNSGNSKCAGSRYDSSSRYSAHNHGYAGKNSPIDYLRVLKRDYSGQERQDRPEWRYERHGEAFDKSDLSLRTICPLCKQSLCRAA